MFKKIAVLSLILISGFCNAESISGSISVSLTILPSQGCSNNVCAINENEVLNKNPDKNYQVSKSDNVLTISF